MSTGQELASKLADDVMAAMEEMDDDRFYMEVAKVIGSSSQTLEEAFLTEIRVRLSERSGRVFLNETLAAHRAKRAE
jgi:hypothetical protein